MSLEDAITYSNNSLIQVGRLMDVRKDFSKANPNELYYMLKEQYRYYKAATPRNVQNLDKKVQSMLKDYSISQAWLKMYEIITDCDLIPTNRKGTYKSFHICEAPGTFINCINNYIHTKTNYDAFEWKSQSLKPKGAMSKATTIGDTYGLIKRYPDKWDFGIDNTGDITNIENIKYYAKMAKDMNINLMTSDCGLPMGDTKYYQVAYASYVSLLYSLPQNGTLLYKVLSPIDVPLIWNLIYITYTNFKEMFFFKPVQNSQSRGFYIIGKGYLGTEQSVLDKLLSLIPKFEESSVGSKFNKEEYDLFNDTYPEEFVIQVQNICERLASNYVNSIERIIYYVDNVDALGKEYKKHIESYMKEKNEDWIRKYKVMKLDKQFVL
jgi:cap2 methyltransferase